jgi:hypothetical protein
LVATSNSASAPLLCALLITVVVWMRSWQKQKTLSFLQARLKLKKEIMKATAAA